MSEAPFIRRSFQYKRQGRTDWAAVDAFSEEEIEARAAEDPDNPVWTEEELVAARLVLPNRPTAAP